MNRWLRWIINYLKYFLMLAGAYYLVSVHESWKSLLKDTYIQIAFLVTIFIMAIDLCKASFKKFTKRKEVS